MTLCEGRVLVGKRESRLSRLTSDVEICYACTHELQPDDWVYPLDDSDQLRWYAHVACVVRFFHQLT